MILRADDHRAGADDERLVRSHGLAIRLDPRRFEPGPLWFAEALLIFTAFFVAWRLLPRPPASMPIKSSFPSNRALSRARSVTGAIAFLLRLVWPVGVNVSRCSSAISQAISCLFAAGCAAADNRWLENIPADRARLWRRIAWIALPVFPIVEMVAPHFSCSGQIRRRLNLQALAYAFWEPFVAWGIILALLSFFQRRFVTLTGIWPSLARRAFLIYIIHPPILVGTALAWRHVERPRF